ncbi:MAG: type II toxin-antitoxin system VapC family toxin [Chloroflexi bacterium]|nr:type II toxin-antitoxin system VapC family toxin [Chloroflexota bacterium]
MTHYFFDSSALVKRYVAEAGTTWVRSITTRSAGNIIIIAQITQAEVVSGAMRRKRDTTITARTAHATRLLIDRHASREYRVVGLTQQIVQRAEDLLELYALRAYDSIQLASALESNVRLVAAGLPVITFVSADTRLLTAAATERLATDDPNAHP